METASKKITKDTRFWIAVISVWGVVLATGWYLIGSLLDNQHASNETTVVIEQPLNKSLDIMPASGPADDADKNPGTKN